MSTINRRGFLRLLGGAAAIAAVPVKLLPPASVGNESIYLLNWAPDKVYMFTPAPAVDWRYFVRIANIDVSKLAEAGPDLAESVKRLNARRS